MLPYLPTLVVGIVVVVVAVIANTPARRIELHMS
jgi:hypothetical protein